jgi:hypothetical protein
VAQTEVDTAAYKAGLGKVLKGSCSELFLSLSPSNMLDINACIQEKYADFLASSADLRAILHVRQWIGLSWGMWIQNVFSVR